MSSYFPSGSTICTTDAPTCGTCVYWSCRKNVMSGLVEYDANEKARCNNQKSPAYQQDVPANHGCTMKENF